MKLQLTITIQQQQQQQQLQKTKNVKRREFQKVNTFHLKEIFCFFVMKKKN